MSDKVACSTRLSDDQGFFLELYFWAYESNMRKIMNIRSAIILSLGLIIASAIIVFVPDMPNPNIKEGEIKNIMVWKYPLGTKPNNSGSHIAEGLIEINTNSGLIIITKPNGLTSIHPMSHVEIIEVQF